MLYSYNMSGKRVEDDDTYDRVFKALGSATRREVLDHLKDGPRRTGDLCAQFPALDRCTVMQHLGVLERAGLVVVRRQGRERWNHLNVLPIRLIHDRWINAYATTAVDLLSNLSADLDAPAAS